MDLYSFIYACDTLILTSAMELQLFQTLSSNRSKPSYGLDYRQFTVQIFFHSKFSHRLILFLEVFLVSSIWIPLTSS